MKAELRLVCQQSELFGLSNYYLPYQCREISPVFRS